MNSRSAALVILVAGAALAAAPGASKHVNKWAPPPTTIEYTRVNYAGPLPLPDVPSRDDWVGPTPDGNRMLYDVTSWELYEGAIPRTAERATVFYGPQGYGYLGTWSEEGVYETWDVPMVVLPPKPKVGATWSATHTKNGVVSERSCEIMASDLCTDGIVSVCDSKRAEGRIILRDHFCPNVGWSGFEAMIVVGENPPVRMWTTGVVRDGVALPEPPPRD